MSRTIRCYNEWYKNPQHPFYKYRHNNRYWQQWRYGKSSAFRCKDALVLIHSNELRHSEWFD